MFNLEGEEHLTLNRNIQLWSTLPRRLFDGRLDRRHCWQHCLHAMYIRTYHIDIIVASIVYIPCIYKSIISTSLSVTLSTYHVYMYVSYQRHCRQLCLHTMYICMYCINIPVGNIVYIPCIYVNIVSTSVSATLSPYHVWSTSLSAPLFTYHVYM